MRRMVAPVETMKEVEIEGARFGGKKTYRWSKDGTVHVGSAADARVLKQAGFTEAGMWVSVGGFVCQSCGFHAVFKKCSRCGGEGVRNG